MKEYKRTVFTVTEFEAEDIITTSGEPSDPSRRVVMNSPSYSQSSGGNSYDFTWNWTLWQ